MKLQHHLSVASSSALLFLFALPVFSQNYLAHAPSCVQSCAALNGFQYNCLPPPTGAAPVSNSDAYKGCFCGQAAGIPAAPTGFCDTCTTPQQGNQLLNWYNGFCLGATASTSTSSLVTSAPPPSTAAPRPHPQTTPSAVPSSSAVMPMPSDSPVVGDPSAGKKGTWWQLHYQWMIMVIVLIIGFSIIIAVGIYFKRRYDRKHNNASPLTSNTPWGPNTTQFRSSSVYEADEAGQMSAVREKHASMRNMQGRSGKSRR